MTLVSENRIDELPALSSPDFDFRKPIRRCEGLHTAFHQRCYFNTGMGTRAVLDHVPPVFAFETFTEVANNDAGVGRSFKNSITSWRLQSVRNAARDNSSRTAARCWNDHVARARHS
jgi:hypothetical protein